MLPWLASFISYTVSPTFAFFITLFQKRRSSAVHFLAGFAGGNIAVDEDDDGAITYSPFMI